MEKEFLFSILLSSKPSEIIKQNEEKIFDIIPELRICKDFNQNNIWHIYDVYEHILHVVDGVTDNLVLRLAALFHDVGKPYVYTIDEDGIGHFYGHWDKSLEIFEAFAKRFNISKDIKDSVSNLILYHDLNIDKLNDNKLDKLINLLGRSGIIMLYQLKQSDLMAQNPKFHYLLGDYESQEEIMLKRIN